MHQMTDFMISRVRVRILELFFARAHEMYYVREITRQTKEEINAVRRELDRMIGYGLLKSEERGNRLYYYLNPSYVFFPELLRMVSKSTGLGGKIRKLKRKLGTLQFVVFAGHYVKGEKPTQGQVDILIVGDVVLAEIEALIKEEQQRLGREINYTVFSAEEFEFRKTRRDPFVMDILYGSNVMVIGDEEEFYKRQIPALGT